MRLWPSFLKNPVISFALFGGLAYWPLQWVLRDVIYHSDEPLRIALTSALTGLSIGIFFNYAPAIWAAIKPDKDGTRDLGHGKWHLLLGIVLAFGTVAMQAVWGAVVREMGRPPWMLQHPINGFFTYSYVCAALLVFVAPSNAMPPSERRAPTGALMLLIFGVSLGFAVGVLI